MKKFSIIVPIYNRSIKLTYESIMNSLDEENRELTELVLIDDGSDEKWIKDNTDYLNLNGPLDTLIINLGTNQGPYIARKYGVTNCTGEYVLFIDSDDEFKELNECLNYVLNNYGKYIYLFNTELKYKDKLITFKTNEVSNLLRSPTFEGKVIKKELINKYMEKSKEVKRKYGEEIELMYKLSQVPDIVEVPDLIYSTSNISKDGLINKSYKNFDILVDTLQDIMNLAIVVTDKSSDLYRGYLKAIYELISGYSKYSGDEFFTRSGVVSEEKILG